MDKIDFWNGFIKSFYSFKDYPRYRNQSGGKTFLYILLLTFIIIIPSILHIVGSKSLFNTILEEHPLPRWEFNADCTLTADKTIIFDGKNFINEYPTEMKDKMLFILDTNVDFKIDDNAGTIIYYNADNGFEYGTIEMAAYSEGVILIGKYGLVIYNKGEIVNPTYSDIDFEVREMLSYNNVINFINSLWTIIIVIVVIFMFISVLFGCLLQTIIALIQNNGKTNCSFGDLFKMAVHARTIPTAIIFLTSFIGLSIPLLFVINYIIGGIFMHKAIKRIASYNANYEIDRTEELNLLNKNTALQNNSVNRSTYSNSGDYGVNSGFHNSSEDDDNK